MGVKTEDSQKQGLESRVSGVRTKPLHSSAKPHVFGELRFLLSPSLR